MSKARDIQRAARLEQRRAERETDVLPGEEWREVPGLPGISASSFGRVQLPETVGEMPNGTPRLYEPRAHPGNWQTSTSGQGRYIINHIVARLVCAAFHGPPPFPDAKCLHLDEDSRNNRSHNLKWGTQKENLNHPGFIAYCKNRTGENNPHVKGRDRRSGDRRP
jgi:hypothetical protein